MIGQHMPDRDQCDRADLLSNLNAGHYAATLAGAGVNVFYFYAKAGLGNSYYPTKTGHYHSALNGRDFVQEMVDACLKHDIVPCMLYEVSDSRLRTEQPDWCHHTTKGVNGQCINSPYGDRMIEETREILSRYPMGSLYFDMLDFGSPAAGDWRCVWCEREFAEKFGRPWAGEAALADEEWLPYIRWRNSVVRHRLDQIKAVRDELAPDVLLEHNYHGVAGWNAGNTWADSMERIDCFTEDIFIMRDGLSKSVTVPKSFASHSRVQPWILNDTCIANYKGGYDLRKPKPLPLYIAESASLCANGVWPCTSVSPDHTGAWDKPTIETITRLNAHLRRREEWLTDTRPVPYAALVHPEWSRNAFGRRDEQYLYNDEYVGWANLLLENHVLFDVLSETLLDSARLTRYRLLVLPSVICLTRAHASAIREFVKRGGLLLAVGETSLADENGTKRADFALADLFGVNFRSGFNSDNNYLVLDQTGELAEPDKACTPWIVVRTGQVEVKARPDAAVHAETGGKLPQIFRSPIAIRERKGTPALVSNRFGKGTCWYFTPRIGVSYCQLPMPEMRRLIGRILSPHLEATAPLMTDAPTCVQVEFRDQPRRKRRIIHLINIQSNINRSRVFGPDRVFGSGLSDEVLPVRNVRMRVRDRGRTVSRVLRVPAGKPLRFEREGEWLHFKLGRIEVHEMIALERG